MSSNKEEPAERPPPGGCLTNIASAFCIDKKGDHSPGLAAKRALLLIPCIAAPVADLMELFVPLCAASFPCCTL
eukprot:scaffold97220_cov13-Tisochrysis_lutea.AAC.1